ncbi:MAG: hypothetical protein U1B79_01285 [Candidatus Pacearchaeota archaeon]|nr:hypothetical protein [Nanoarchaeota archaeon]MDZ4226724.1 hypothetical protein [Candidatus Pacearchaeota archaeon]
MARKYFRIPSPEYMAKLRPILREKFKRLEVVPGSWSPAEGYIDRKEGVVIGYDGREFMGMEAPTIRAIERTRSGLEKDSEIKLEETTLKNG